MAKANNTPVEEPNRNVASGLSSKHLKGYITLNNTVLRIVHGDITDHQTDVLVNSTDKSLSMQGTHTSITS